MRPVLPCLSRTNPYKGHGFNTPLAPVFYLLTTLASFSCDPGLCTEPPVLRACEKNVLPIIGQRVYVEVAPSTTERHLVTL